MPLTDKSMKRVSLATNDIGTKITVLDILMRTKTFDNRSEILKNSARGETMIFMFEMGDFSAVQKSADLVKLRTRSVFSALRLPRDTRR